MADRVGYDLPGKSADHTDFLQRRHLSTVQIEQQIGTPPLLPYQMQSGAEGCECAAASGHLASQDNVNLTHQPKINFIDHFAMAGL